VRVEVTDDGGDVRVPVPATRGVSEGFGLVGMRERVESTGGRLVAGPQPAGGFRIVATWATR
jgi:signal transduction histidine kinase